MDTSLRTKVSLRGASSKEITRDALLEKAALEREIRSQTRKAVAAAQLIQRVWRGHSVVSQASDVLRAEWDKYVTEVWKAHDDVPNPLLCDTILRPFLFFFGISFKKKNSKYNGDLERLVTCITILLKSINSEDSSYNYCTLSTGNTEEQMTWFYQMHKMMRLCCIGLVEGSTWSNHEMSKLANLSVRMLVALTDSSMWRSFKQDNIKAEAKMVIQKLLERVADKSHDFYPAIATCISQSCHTIPEYLGHSDKFQKEKFIVVASAITLALRPLQILTPELNDKTYQKVQEAFCSHILTISLITECLPAAMVPALQHPSVLAPSLKALETLNIGQVPVKPSYRDIASSGWALINIVSLAKNSKKEEFVKDLAFEAYVGAICSLLDQLQSWVKKLKHEFKNGADVFSLVCTGPSKCDDSDESCPVPSVTQKLIDKLEPLYQQWHLKELLDRTDMKFSSSNVDVKKMEGVASDTTTLKLTDIVILYSKLLNVCTMLQSGQGSSPVLNVLAFAPGFLHQIWDWLDEALGLTRSWDAKHSTKLDKKVETVKYSEPGTSHRKDDKSGGVLSTRWASAMSKIKGKGSTLEMFESDKTNTEHFDKENIMRKWNFECVPGSLSNEVLSMLKLFCAAYGHLLVILDDDEFYERQVPFTLKQQRIIVGFLNSLVYHGLCSPSKQNFMPLMGSAIKCLKSLYGRDCRRSFCHPSLWLSPAVSNRPPIPASARAHEVAMASIKNGEFSQAPPIGYVLTLIPHVIPFEDRVQIFREFIKSDKMTRKMAGEIMGPGPGSIEIAIRRDHLIEDAFAQLNSLGSKLKSSINVSFVNECGLAEAGLDYGGLFKEFLTDLAKAAFDPGYGLFAQKETEEGYLFPHPAAGSLQHGLPMIEFLGRIVGKAMYEGILLDYSFSHVFIRKLLGHYIFLDELSTLDPELHQSLMYLKHYDGDAKELALDFTITEELFGRRTVVELVPDGANIPVTNENKLQYVHAMADYKLNRQMQPLISAFSRGLSDIISPSWLSLFNAKELNQLLSGGEHDFDVDDLKANTKYTGGFTENSRTVKQFWEVLSEFEPKERCALLKFVTSCSRAPLLGFKYLQPAFTIHKVNCDTTLWAMLGGQDVDRLPTASTCYNTLKLPTYKRMSTLRSKLRYAINSNAGFELS